MDIKRRFKLFGFGIILGLGLSYFFFQGRLNVFTDWMPGNRVKFRLRSTYVGNSPEVDALIKANNWPDTLANCFMWEGDVIFSTSKTRSEPKEYILKYKLGNVELQANFQAADSTAIMIDLEPLSYPD